MLSNSSTRSGFADGDPATLGPTAGFRRLGEAASADAPVVEKPRAWHRSSAGSKHTGGGAAGLAATPGAYALNRDHRRQSCAVFLATDGNTVTPWR